MQVGKPSRDPSREGFREALLRVPRPSAHQARPTKDGNGNLPLPRLEETPDKPDRGRTLLWAPPIANTVFTPKVIHANRRRVTIKG